MDLQRLTRRSAVAVRNERLSLQMQNRRAKREESMDLSPVPIKQEKKENEAENVASAVESGASGAEMSRIRENETGRQPSSDRKLKAEIKKKKKERNETENVASENGLGAEMQSPEGNQKRKNFKITPASKKRQRQNWNAPSTDETSAENEENYDPNYVEAIEMDETSVLDELSMLDEAIELDEVNGLDETNSDEDESPVPKTSSDGLLEISHPTPGVDPKLDLFYSCGSKTATNVFRWLIYPTSTHNFFTSKFERSPCVLQRENKAYYGNLFSTQVFDNMVKENNLYHEVEIDVVKYEDGNRIIPEDVEESEEKLKVNRAFMWKCYQEGYTIRMRNPQAYHNNLRKLCSYLEEYLSCGVGCNMYLTPRGTQGFPPHWDDIDAFILQVEGSKVWKLHRTRDLSEKLPRESSGDLSQNEVGEPFMVRELKQGDLLYLPRGCIHQAFAKENEHSMHLTISANQCNTYGDLLQVGLQQAITKAMKDNVEFRKTLPTHYSECAGAAYADCNSQKSKDFHQTVQQLAKKTLEYFSVDDAADEMASEFIHGSLPPVFDHDELSHSVHGKVPGFKDGNVIMPAPLTLDTKIRWIRKRALRLTMDGEEARLFYNLDNSRSPKEKDALFYIVEDDLVPAVCTLFQNFPHFIQVRDLNVADEDAVAFAQEMYDRGFLLTASVLPIQEPEE